MKLSKKAQQKTKEALQDQGDSPLRAYLGFYLK